MFIEAYTCTIFTNMFNNLYTNSDSKTCMGKQDPYIKRIEVPQEKIGVNHFTRVWDILEGFGYDTCKHRFTTIGNGPMKIKRGNGKNRSKIEKDISFLKHSVKTRKMKKQYGYAYMSLENSRNDYSAQGKSSVTSRIEMFDLYDVESALVEWEKKGTIEHLVQCVLRKDLDMHNPVHESYAQELVSLNLATLLQGVVVETLLVENTNYLVFAGESADLGGIDLYDTNKTPRLELQIKSMKDMYNNNHSNVEKKLVAWVWLGNEIILCSDAKLLAGYVKEATNINISDFSHYQAFPVNSCYSDYWNHE